MIKQEDIQSIIETARIEEVVGDYVNLKKRGINLLGLCPFHNEKTPSFTVSPVKGIYKCFGCGKAGNAVNFIMEHEHFSYPEALRYLAKKYNIELDEELPSPEQIAAFDEKESLFNITAFAHKHFVDNLFNTDEGKAIGLSYFKEREFTEATIKKFELGYTLDKWDEFTQYANKNGYTIQQLEKAGLSTQKDGKSYDRFRARVMFPIHSLSGKVIAFGGRILDADKSKPKYVNSPETDIYNKSKVLYGLNFAKNAISAKDNCFLVEGYTDVITLHQAGIENVVASSGTSLTTEQIKLIYRYTKNITILYDGDPAGIKASFRGIDMILEQGMNVKIVLFPDGEDPDSFTRKNRSAEVLDYISANAHNFILFKTNLLLAETANDPIKRAGLIKEIVATISLIPDQINRTVYTRECSSLLDISEQTLIHELNKLLRKKLSKAFEAEGQPELPISDDIIIPKTDEDINLNSLEYQENFIIRIIFLFGERPIVDNEEINNVTKLIINEIKKEGFELNNLLYREIFDIYSSELENDNIPPINFFIHHPNKEIRELAINILSSPYLLSENWEKMHHIYVPIEYEDKVLVHTITESLYHFKLRTIEKMIFDLETQMKVLKPDEDFSDLMLRTIALLNAKKDICKIMKIVTPR